MNLNTPEERGDEPNPELTAELTQLFNDRANRFEPQPNSYERLHAASIAPELFAPSIGRRVEYLAVAAVMLLIAGSVAGLTLWTGTGRGDSAEQTQAASRVDVRQSANGNVNNDTDSADDGLGRPDAGGDPVVLGSDPDASASESAGSSSSSTEPSKPELTSTTSTTSTPDESAPEPSDSDTTSSTEASTTTSTTTATSTSSTTESEDTTTSTTSESRQLAKPQLEALKPNIQSEGIYLFVQWERVPGAAGYEKVYTMNGVEIDKPTMFNEPVAITHYTGTPGSQYCLQVVATSPTRPDSEPANVCSVKARPMTLSIRDIYVGDTTQVGGFDLSWTDLEAAPRYEVTMSWNSQSEEFVTSTEQPRASIDLEGKTGRFCFSVLPLDARGIEFQSISQCHDVQDMMSDAIDPPSGLVAAHKQFINKFFLTSCSETPAERRLLIESTYGSWYERDRLLSDPALGCPLRAPAGDLVTTEIVKVSTSDGSRYDVLLPWGFNCQVNYQKIGGLWKVVDRACG